MSNWPMCCGISASSLRQLLKLIKHINLNNFIAFKFFTPMAQA